MSSQSPRRLLPKVEEGKAPSEPVQLAKKRKLAPIACARCRSHKTKCDGNRPSCGMCRARNVECTYNDDPNTTTAANLRRQYHCLAEQHQSFHELFEMLRSRPEEEALVILRHFRSSGNVQSTLQYMKEGYLVTATHMAGSDADEIPLPPCPKNREEFMLGIDHPNAYPFLPPLEELKSSLGFQMRMIPEANPKTADWVTEEEVENARHLDRARELEHDRLLHVKAADWTTVTSNDIIVQNLISLYLSWDHATMRLFDEELFLDQISSSKTDHEHLPGLNSDRINAHWIPTAMA
ncbi:C6 transcription factor [Apiospora marii]|uniref:C6 transcription factor n=1 Tax=Apiospora marii TaxID=335849 RepID=UPI00312F48DD